MTWEHPVDDIREAIAAARDVPPFYEGPLKLPCPCDAGRPQDCRPEQHSGAHSPADCLACGRPRYQHRDRRFCPTIPAQREESS